MQGNLKIWFAAGIGIILLLLFWLYSAASAIEPEGTLYMTLRELPGEANPVSIYAYDFETNDLINQSTDEGDYITNKYSPDGSKIAFGAYAVDGAKIYTVTNEFANVTPVAGPAGLLIARNPTWSPDGNLIAYQGKEDDIGDDLDVEQWMIFIANQKTGQYKFVTTGTSPMFGPNGELLVLKEDGVYLFPTSNIDWSNSDAGLEGDLVIGIEEGVGQANMKLGLSLNGSKLAWSVPDLETLYIYNISSWSPFSASLSNETQTFGFWPVFSPDGKYLALIEVEYEEGFEEGFPSLVVFHTGSMQRKQILDLSQYEAEAMFLTDWRY
ncbi:MAG TPA: hypothetical protein VD928_00250 [Candidatus Paceibacterota bacterium]|nr:hypothetical protein [Candidatus Paceibacterota bacterium]